MAVKGAVLGDILGSQYEFHRPKKLDWKNVPLINKTNMGFTDDTVMMMAIKKAIAEEFYRGFGNVDADSLLESYLDDYLLAILER